MKQFFSFLLSGICMSAIYGQNSIGFTVKAGQPVAEIQSTMWGVFFEDINFAADGGVYAELVKNRSFEFNNPLMGWKILNENNGSLLILNRGSGKPSNPRIARISVSSDNGIYGLKNEGFRGMGIKQGEQYDFSMLARMNDGNANKIKIELQNEKGETIGSSNIQIGGSEWKEYTASFTATATSAKASMNIWFSVKGVIDVDMISLFPRNTWKNRPRGLRADLVQKLADLKPGFFRFPGGCIVEGHELETRYQWKKTVGNIMDRELNVNRWNNEMKHRLTPDYYQSYGLGFYEYFQLSEDIGAAPVPILNCGMACQYNSSEVVPLDALDPYIEDALDLIEFANGAVTTKWGKLRSDMGHPAPFNLKMLGIGNEQWGPQYVERYKIFAEAIHNKYPDIKLVSGVGPGASGPLFDFLDPLMREMKADVLDEHYYMPPEWFQNNASRYDHYDRNGPKIFAGEYAAHVRNTTGAERNNWLSALSEAAFMTGLERNADVVYMASYAPLFAHIDAWQWAPNLIWFDNLDSYGTPNYYVQKLFSNYKGTHSLPVLQNNQPMTGQQGLYASSSIDKDKKQLILKIVNVSDSVRNIAVNIEGVKLLQSAAQCIVLKSERTDVVNSFDNVKAIMPSEEKINVKGKKLDVVSAPYSFMVLSFDLKD